ncbi:hypothetical protein EJ04DRAFT_567323 [Polyplosphaeria fusca]|uniref:Uncharacterized protein n=1 Tax=Polyplosphaeria fusca TaxID=682080 RepID=A0A9P4QQY4_9PLEO|nr:hypothetical protein EJ04DRAFT_567323 [Polyplosphaeria fusca]
MLEAKPSTTKKHQLLAKNMSNFLARKLPCVRLRRSKKAPKLPKLFHSPSGPFLLGLPSEIRNQIYQLALTHKIPITVQIRKRGSSSKGGLVLEGTETPPNALKAVCRQLRYETAGLELRYNNIEIHSDPNSPANPADLQVYFRHFLSSLPPIGFALGAIEKFNRLAASHTYAEQMGKCRRVVLHIHSNMDDEYQAGIREWEWERFVNIAIWYSECTFLVRHDLKVNKKDFIEATQAIAWTHLQNGEILNPLFPAPVLCYIRATQELQSRMQGRRYWGPCNVSWSGRKKFDSNDQLKMFMDIVKVVYSMNWVPSLDWAIAVAVAMTKEYRTLFEEGIQVFGLDEPRYGTWG